MAGYADLLRGSRLVALPPAIKSASKTNIHPTRPAIRTTRANQAIGDWGLKRPLPKLRTKNITITDIDTQEHQTPFDSSNKYTKVVERWQEMGLAIHGPPTSKDFTEAYAYIGARPENVNKGINMQYLPRADAKKLISKARKLRKSFMAAKQIKPDTIYSTIERNSAKNRSNEFLGIVSNTVEKIYSVQANGGLGYHHSGALSLFNTPTGPRERQLTARVLTGRTTKAIGLGGIVTRLRETATAQLESAYQKQGRAATIKIYGGDAKFNDDGHLSLTLSTDRPMTYSRTSASEYAAERVWSRFDIGASTRRSGNFKYGDLMGFTDNDMESAPLSDILKQSPVFQNAAKERKVESPEVKSKDES